MNRLLIIVFATLASTGCAYFRTMANMGDSVSRGYNARTKEDDDKCADLALNVGGDEYEDSIWISGDKISKNFLNLHNAEFPAEKIDRVLNAAESGATMVDDVARQTERVVDWLTTTATQRPALVTVFLGHNDACGGSWAQNNWRCDSGDEVANDYCRKDPSVFGRQFSDSLDTLVQLDGVTMVVIPPVRLGSLCRFADKRVSEHNEKYGNTCGKLWTNGLINSVADLAGSVGLCGSLTGHERYWFGWIKDRGCSRNKIDRMHRTQVEYYNSIREKIEAVNQKSHADTRVYLVDSFFHYKFKEDELSKCDCFHPYITAQENIADILWHGLKCGQDGNQCCKDDDFACTQEEDSTSTFKGVKQFITDSTKN